MLWVCEGVVEGGSQTVYIVYQAENNDKDKSCVWKIGNTFRLDGDLRLLLRRFLHQFLRRSRRRFLRLKMGVLVLPQRLGGFCRRGGSWGI